MGSEFLKPKISIIIPTYCPSPEVEECLARCFQSIFANTDLSDAELVVIEQGRMVAGNLLRSEYLNFSPRTFYHHSKSPLGYAKAVNLGIGYAKGDHFVIVNNDIEVDPGCLNKLVAKYIASPRMGLLAAACTDPEWANENIEEPQSWWSCICISREVWNRVGKLDCEKLNYRLHDQDYSIRTYNVGYRVGIYRGATVRHGDGETYKRMNIDETAERNEIRRRWGHEHFADYVKHHPRS